MGQVGDFTNYFKKETSYFDPILWHNNQQKPYKGYCSDIFTENAIDFIEKNREQPFFCYLSFNAPHTPLQVPEMYYDMYKNIDPNQGIDAELLPSSPMSDENIDDARKVYAMVTNIDDNLNRLFQKVEDLGIEEYSNESDSILFIEWPERGDGFFKECDMEICLNHLNENSKEYKRFLETQKIK